MNSSDERYDKYLRDFDPSPTERGQGYSSPLNREDWEAEFLCPSILPSGEYCTREVGHAGPHMDREGDSK